MSHSKSSSSKATARAPFAPATELDHVPIVFYEIKYLATRGQSAEIVPLIDSIIAVTQQHSDALSRLPPVVLDQVENNLANQSNIS
jgi:hypothetical protein